MMIHKPDYCRFFLFTILILGFIGLCGYVISITH